MFLMSESKELYTLSGDAEPLCDLFFELSNEVRLDIIRLIEGKPSKLSQIAKELDLPVQEVSRQLARLLKVRLIAKNPEGFYLVSPQGRNVIRLLPGFMFLSKNSDYLDKNSLDNVPSSFMGRIGELVVSTIVEEIMNTFVSVE